MSDALTILVTGASGLIGRALCTHGAEKGWNVIRLRRHRAPAGAKEAPVGAFWDSGTARRELASGRPLDAVIHLAGETVAQRWTKAARRRIHDSRVRGTEKLGELLAELSVRPEVVICASAMGYYGNRGDAWIDEDAPAGEGFLAEVCQDWEAAAQRALGVVTSRLVRLRLGLVLTPQGGALAGMLPAFRLGLGGRLGDGQQYWSWIALSDLVQAIEYLLTHRNLAGPINAVAPNPVTNAEFTRALGQAIHRPTILSVPRMVIGALLGQMGREGLLFGARVRPRRLLEAGFEFGQPTLEKAFSACLGTASETR